MCIRIITSARVPSVSPKAELPAPSLESLPTRSMLIGPLIGGISLSLPSPVGTSISPAPNFPAS